MSYIDTSVIVAALNSLDPRQQKAREILEKEELKIVSELTVVELSSVLSKRRELVSSISSELNIDEELVIITMILYIFKRFSLTYTNVDGQVYVPLIGKIYKPVSFAIDLSVKTGLKTLDLLHLAYAKILKEEGIVNKFVTADEDFLKIKKTIEKSLNIKLQLL